MTIDIKRTVSLDAPLAVEPLHGVAFTAEHAAHKFTIACYQGGSHVSLTGSVTARFLRADGTTVDLPSQDFPDLTGIDDNGDAFVILHQLCYAVSGRFQLSVFNVRGTDSTTCIYSCVGSVQRTSSGSEVVPGTTVPDYSTMASIIDDCEDAAEDARTAAQTASNAVSYSDQSSEEHSEADKAQARENIGAAGVDTTEIFCDINGQIIQRESGATTVPIDAETGRPTTTPWASAKSYTGECAEGDQYVFFGRARSDVRLGFMFIAADGTILVSYAKTSADDFTLYTAPAGTAFVYFLKTNSGAGDANRLWKVEYISPVVGALMKRVAALEGSGASLMSASLTSAASDPGTEATGEE